MNERTKTQALKALAGLATIVRNERLIRGEYISSYVDPKLTGAICQGHKACLLGSLWLAGGVKPEERWPAAWRLPGVSEGSRDQFLAHRHGLRAAYNALNTAAERRLERLSPAVRQHIRMNANGLSESAAEMLFEGRRQTRTDLLRFIASARRSIQKA